MLRYYGAAWAVLRCCHVDELPNLEESRSTDDLHDGLHSHQILFLHFGERSWTLVQKWALDKIGLVGNNGFRADKHCKALRHYYCSSNR